MVLKMAEYIKREAAVKAVEKYGLTNGVVWGRHTGLAICIASEIVDIPAADVAPVVHGRWIRPHWKNNNYCCDCSECGGEAMHRDYQWNKNGVYPICPHCGAKMDGGADHAAD